jgi:ABC-type nitrate/sulfonate/bicarbonate transport systems, periplasmic components
MLDWFPNPDHVPLYVAQARGMFAEEGLAVTLQAPADPNDPPKLAAAGKVDVAISYQPSLTFARNEGLPLRAFGVLVAQPLNTLMTLKGSGIRSLADLKGKRVGYSVSGFEEALLSAMLKEAGLTLKDVRLVNVHFNLTPALLSGQVDAVVGAYRNYESVVLEQQGKTPVMFPVEAHGVPTYYELIFVASETTLQKKREVLRRFVRAVQRAIDWSRAHPDSAYALYARANPDADPKIDPEAFRRTLPTFARSQRMDPGVWARFTRFLQASGLVADTLTVEGLYLNLGEEQP